MIVPILSQCTEDDKNLKERLECASFSLSVYVLNAMCVDSVFLMSHAPASLLWGNIDCKYRTRYDILGFNLTWIFEVAY